MNYHRPTVRLDIKTMQNIKSVGLHITIFAKLHMIDADKLNNTKLKVLLH